MKIYLVNLPLHLNDTDIRQLFERYGEVDSVKVITEKNTGRSKGCAYLEMPTQKRRVMRSVVYKDCLSIIWK